MSSKMQMAKHSQKMTTFWQDGKNTVKVCLRNMAALVPVGPTTDCDGNEQGNSSETTDEDDEEPIPLRSEVELAVKQLKNGKATGCDDISAEMIKASGELGISLLHKLIVKLWQTGEWPEDGRRAVLIPIPKKGDLQQCSNYRTISLISHASKVMLKIIMKRIERKLQAERECGSNRF